MEVVAKAQLPILKLGANTKIPTREDIPDGNIILIRFIRSNRFFNSFGERFKILNEDGPCRVKRRVSPTAI